MTIIKVNSSGCSRLDRYIRRIYPYLTQGTIERALRLKRITVNSSKSSANLRITDKDEIYIDDGLIKLEKPNIKESFSNSVVSLAIKITNEYLIYDHKEFIAINKPSRLASQAGSKINISIDDAISYLNRGNNSPDNNYRLVHRLDKDTSGILLIAKNYDASVKLTKAFKEKTIKKTYIAVTLGLVQKQEGEISCKIIKNRDSIYETCTESRDGKEATTGYKLLNIIDDRFSIMEFHPITGRTHQLRFHAQKLNIPIVGDVKYGNDKSKYISEYMLLHAKKLVIDQSIFGDEIIIESKLPDYFAKYSLVK